MDGEVRIRNYFNEFQHNHHNLSHNQDFEFKIKEERKIAKNIIVKANIIFKADTAAWLQRICNFQSKFVAHIQTKLNDLTIT